MRVLFLMAWFALAGGCSSFGVRCDSHLRPINPRQPPLSHQPPPSSTPGNPAAAGAVASEQVRP